MLLIKFHEGWWGRRMRVALEIIGFTDSVEDGRRRSARGRGGWRTRIDMRRSILDRHQVLGEGEFFRLYYLERSLPKDIGGYEFEEIDTLYRRRSRRRDGTRADLVLLSFPPLSGRLRRRREEAQARECLDDGREALHDRIG